MTDVRTVRAAPTWIRALGSVVRRLPRGRYQIVSSLRSSASPFVSTLGRELGAARFTCDLSDLISREVCLTGCYEPPVTRLLQRRLGRGGTMVDVGANWGYFTLLAAAVSDQEGRVISLEPDPRHFDALEANVRLNGFYAGTVDPEGGGRHRRSCDPRGLRRSGRQSRCVAAGARVRRPAIVPGGMRSRLTV